MRSQSSCPPQPLPGGNPSRPLTRRLALLGAWLIALAGLAGPVVAQTANAEWELGLLPAPAQVPHTAKARTKPDMATPKAGQVQVLQDAADWLITQQSGNGGFPWTVGGVNTRNTQGATALGLLRAYAHTGDSSHLAAAVANGECFLAGNGCITGFEFAHGGHRFATHDPLFLIELTAASGDPAYADLVQTEFWDKLASSQYGEGQDLDAATYAASVMTSRAGGGNQKLVAWDLSKTAIAASLAGESSAHAAFMDVIEESLEAAGSTYDVIGLAGGLWAAASTGWSGTASHADLATALLGYQQPDGGFPISSTGTSSSAQTTSFAVQALAAVDPVAYQTQIAAGFAFIASVQQPDGQFLENLAGSPTAGGGIELHGEMLEAYAVVWIASDRYVATTGSDTGNDCSVEANPCATIQHAVNQADIGNTIRVAAGSYVENVVIDRPVTLLGAQADVDAGPRGTRDGNGLGETVIVPAAAATGVSVGGAHATDWSSTSGAVIRITSDGVVVNGVVVDADNPDLDTVYASGRPDMNGANPDVAIGVSITDRSAVEVINVVVRNSIYYGIGGTASAPAPSDRNIIANNRIINSDGHGYGVGVLLYDNIYAHVDDNHIEQVRTGIQAQSLTAIPPTPGFEAQAEGNLIKATGVGIWANVLNGAGSPPTFHIRSNTINAYDQGADPTMTSQWVGIWVHSLTRGGTVSITGNSIDGSDVDGGRTGIGYLLGNVVNDGSAANVISGGSVSHVDIGVLATDSTRYDGPVDDFEVTDVDFSSIALAAFYVEDTQKGPPASSAHLSIGSGNSYDLAPSAHALVLSGPGASVEGVAVDDVFVRSGQAANIYGSTDAAVSAGTINNGIAAAAVDGVVQVEAGSFAQAVTVNKRVRLLGAQAGVDAKNAVAARTGGETIIAPDAPVRISIPAAGSGAEVDGFTITGISSTTPGSSSAFSITASGVKVRNNRIIGINGHGVYLSNNLTQDILVERNRFADISGGSYNGVKTEASNELRVINNRFDGIAYQAVQLGGNNIDAVVRGNHVANIANAGINIGGGSGITVSDNILVNADSGAADRAAIRIYAGVDAAVSCNIIEASNSRGIYFHASGGAHVANVFHNAILASTAALVNGHAGQALVGSNWYGGGTASTSGGQLLVADAFGFDPTIAANRPEGVACGDNAPATLVAVAGTPQDANVNQPFGSDLVARLQDALGGAVVNADVTLTSPASGTSATLNPPSPAVQATDFNGEVRASATANNYAGSYNVVASSTGVADLSYVLTNLANYQVLFDIDGPVAGVKLGETVAYAGTLSNNDPALEEVFLRIRVSATDDASTPIPLAAADVLLNAFHPINGSPLPLVWPVSQPFPGELSAQFPADATGGALASLDIRPVSPATVFESLQNLAAMYARPGLYQAQIEVVGAVSGTVYAIDSVHTEVIDEHAGVSLDLQGPVAGVEKGANAEYNLLLSNTEAAVADEVRIELVFTRGGGITAGDIDVYYYDSDTDDYVLLPLIVGVAELSASIGPYTLGDGSTTPVGILENLRIVYNVAPHTFQIAATVVDASGDTDGVALYAGDNIATDVIEADPDVELDLSGPFDADDGVTPVAARVGETVILRGELRNEGGNVQAPVRANVLVGASVAGMQASNIVGTYGFLADIDDDCDTAVFSESLSFTEAGGTLSAQTSPQPLPEGMAVAVCFQLEFQRAGVYSIGAAVADAVDPGQTYAADNLTFTVGKGAATVTLDDLGPYLFDGDDKPASASTTPTGLTVDIAYNGAAAPLPQAVGSYVVQATVVSDDWEGSATGVLIINPATDSGLVLQNLTVTYDGNPHGVAAEIVAANPNGASFTVSYSGTTVGGSSYGPTSVPPVQAGSYTATVSIDDSRYEALDLFASVDIDPASATVSFGNLSHVYDGTSKAAAVTTVPAGVSGVSLSYSPDAAPTNAGSYTVTATLSNPNYVLAGVDTATLTIDKATAQIFLSNLTQVYDGTQKAVTLTTVPAALASDVEVSYTPAVPVNVGSYAVEALLEGHPNYEDVSANATLSIIAATIAGFEIIGDDSFSGVAGEALTGALPTVRVYDTSGLGVPGISVEFAVTAGAGSIEGAASAAVTTGADGQATVPEWVLGAVAGANAMTAATGMAGLQELEFSATGEQVAQLSIDKSVNLTQAHAGQVLDYSIVVANDGPSTVQATLLDAIPDGLEDISWICLGEDGALCGEASGNGDIDFDSTIPAGGSITVTISATVAADATTGQAMVNTAVVTWLSEGEEQEAEASASTNIVPAYSGPCSIFCDGFEDIDLGKRLALPEAADAAAVHGWDLVSGQSGRPQLAVELVDGAGQAVAWLDSLKIGEQSMVRLRSLDGQGKQRAGTWQAWPAGASVNYGWELDFDGLRLDFVPAGAAKAGALLQLQLPAGAAIPERARSHAATAH